MLAAGMSGVRSMKQLTEATRHALVMQWPAACLPVLEEVRIELAKDRDHRADLRWRHRRRVDKVECERACHVV